MPVKSEPIVLKNVTKSYGGPKAPVVLGGIDLTVSDGEIIAILGQSGCGKSTLLRIIAGLIPASGGEVLYRGKPVTGPMPGIAMVFQSFALFPWMTVLENVAFGLEAQGVPAAERRTRALNAISLIGLDGFENAYPKELSGGMRQRVGFARALVVNPDVLLLDEPFSALDVLTAETLRGDLMSLWSERRIPTRGIVFISHNINEAVEVSDRIIVLAPHPGRVRSEIRITLPQPRNPESAAFKAVVADIYRQLAADIAHAHPVAARAEAAAAYRLPAAGVQPMLGLIDAIDDAPFHGRATFAELADHEGLEMDQLLVLVQGLRALGFAAVSENAIALSDAGRAFHEADVQERKGIFAQHLIKHVPLIRRIMQVLEEQSDHRARETRILTELEGQLSEEDAQEAFDTAVNWARFAELFSYDYDSGILSLESAVED
jgi:NitT/TauT family transport system ATP-binding protein